MISLVLERLYLGNKAAAASLEQLQSRGIDTIVNVGGGANRFEHLSTMQYLRIGRVSDRDDASLSEHLDAASAFIDRALADGRTVLVHCKGGISRSPTIVIAFLVACRELSLLEAFQVCRLARPAIRLNVSFKRELEQFELAIRGESSAPTCSQVRSREW